MRRNVIWFTVTTAIIGLLIAWQANLPPSEEGKGAGENPACAAGVDPAQVAANPECQHEGKAGERK